MVSLVELLHFPQGENQHGLALNATPLGSTGRVSPWAVPVPKTSSKFMGIVLKLQQHRGPSISSFYKNIHNTSHLPCPYIMVQITTGALFEAQRNPKRRRTAGCDSRLHFREPVVGAVPQPIVAAHARVGGEGSIEVESKGIWMVVVKSIVPFLVLNIIRHLVLRGPKKGPYF